MQIDFYYFHRCRKLQKRSVMVRMLVSNMVIYSKLYRVNL